MPTEANVAFVVIGGVLSIIAFICWKLGWARPAHYLIVLALFAFFVAVVGSCVQL